MQSCKIQRYKKRYTMHPPSHCFLRTPISTAPHLPPLPHLPGTIAETFVHLSRDSLCMINIFLIHTKRNILNTPFYTLLLSPNNTHWTLFILICLAPIPILLKSYRMFLHIDYLNKSPISGHLSCLQLFGIISMHYTDFFMLFCMNVSRL